MELFKKITKEDLEVINWLTKCTKGGSWEFNKKTGLLDVKGDFNCHKQNLKDFKGVKFGVVTGTFNCSKNNLTSLEGAPQKIGRAHV